MPARLEQLQKLLAAEPNDAFCLYGLGQEYATLGQHDRAIEFYDRTLAADPSYFYAFYHKARSQQAIGDVAGAAATLRDGLAAARKAGDAKAVSELAALLDELT